jgi:hypothetical protein
MIAKVQMIGPLAQHQAPTLFSVLSRIIRLGTNTKLTKPAQSLYRSYGFREIAVYPESEILPEEWMDSLFFEKDLEE